MMYIDVFSENKEYFQSILDYDKLNPKRLKLNEKVREGC